MTCLLERCALSAQTALRAECDACCVLAGSALCGAAAACLALSLMPASLGIPGYVAPIMLLTASYALFPPVGSGVAPGASTTGFGFGMLYTF